MNSESDYIDLLSERQKWTKLYEDWLKLRDLAKKNADGKLPEGFDDMFAPPPPLPIDDIDIEHLSMDLSAASLDAEIAQDLDDSGIERVPMADPGLEVSKTPISQGLVVLLLHSIASVWKYVIFESSILICF